MQRRHWLLLFALLALIVPSGAAMAAPSDNAAQQTSATAAKGDRNACPDKSKNPTGTPPSCGKQDKEEPPPPPPPGPAQCTDDDGQLVIAVPADPLAFACVVLGPTGADDECPGGAQLVEVPANPAVYVCVTLLPTAAAAAAT